MLMKHWADRADSASIDGERGLKPPGASGLPRAPVFPKQPANIGPSSGRTSQDGQGEHIRNVVRLLCLGTRPSRACASRVFRSIQPTGGSGALQSFR